MHKYSVFKSLFFIAIFLLFASCDKDFNGVGESLIGDNNFEIVKYASDVVSYNEKITPIQSGNLPINALGIYENSAFGVTTASFVTQLTLASVNPTIGKNPVIDSVYIDIPYFIDASKTEALPIKTAGVAAGNTYVLDSIYGLPTAKIKLSIYESGRYMGTQSAIPQVFYTNQSAEFDKFKVGNRLNDAADKSQNDEFFFNPKQNTLITTEPDNKETRTYSPPSMRLKLNAAFFKEKIIDAAATATSPGSGKLATNDVFINHFKGLYFKVEQSGSDKGSLAMINFNRGTITIKYKEDKSETDATKVEKSIVLNMSGNTVSLLQDNDLNTEYDTTINNPDRNLGDKRLFLKGGQGSLAVINLFGSADKYNYEVLTNADKKPIDENGNIIPLESDGKPISGYFLVYTKKFTPNGISDELDDIRFPLINDSQGQIYHSTNRRWLINDANLVFYIDTDNAEFKKSHEPERIYLYDYSNNTPILDYVSSAPTTNKNSTKFAFGGFIKRDATELKRGVSYKINITNHVRNLVKNTTSENVKLGLVVTEDINIFDSNLLEKENLFIRQAPKSSVMNPLGTILYGTGTGVPDTKRLKLEINYTKPK